MARRSSPVELIISSEVTAEANALTDTPARIRLVVGMVLPTLASCVTTSTDSMAPLNAAMGTAISPSVV